MSVVLTRNGSTQKSCLFNIHFIFLTIVVEEILQQLYQNNFSLITDLLKGVSDDVINEIISLELITFDLERPLKGIVDRVANLKSTWDSQFPNLTMAEKERLSIYLELKVIDAQNHIDLRKNEKFEFDISKLQDILVQINKLPKEKSEFIINQETLKLLTIYIMEFVYYQLLNDEELVNTYAKYENELLGYLDKAFMGQYYWGCLAHDYGTVFIMKGEYKIAIKHYLDVVEIRYQTKDYTGAARSLVNLGYSYRQIGDNDKALECYNKSLDIHYREHDRINSGLIYSNIGAVHCKEGRFKEGEKYYQLSYEIRTEFDLEEELAMSHANFGNLYSTSGELDKGIEHFEKALEIYTKYEREAKIAQIHRSLATSYVTQGEYNKAKDFLIKSLEIRKKLQNNKDTSDSLNGLIILATDTGTELDYNSYLQDLRDLHDKDDNPFIHLSLLHCEGMISLHIKKDLTMAKSTFIELIEKSNKVDYEIQKSAIFNYLHILLSELSEDNSQENISEVKKYAEQLLHNSTEENLYPDILKIYILLSKLQLFVFNYEGSIGYLRTAKDILESRNMVYYQRLLDDSIDMYNDHYFSYKISEEEYFSMNDEVIADLDEYLNDLIQNRIEVLLFDKDPHSTLR